MYNFYKDAQFEYYSPINPITLYTITVIGVSACLGENGTFIEVEFSNSSVPDRVHNLSGESLYSQLKRHNAIQVS